MLLRNWASVALLALATCGNPPAPPSPSPGWQTYGGNEPAISNNSFQFPTSSSGTAGYFFKQTFAQLNQTLTLNYSITGNNPQWAQHPQSGSATDTDPASITLFLWRQGDDLGSDKASYRFWCPARNVLVLGDNQMLSCVLSSPAWTNVAGLPDPNGFAAALANELGLGFTFGGASFYGHGVYLSSGSATFKINSFTVQ
jgi:hypothetical protein